MQKDGKDKAASSVGRVPVQLCDNFTQTDFTRTLGQAPFPAGQAHYAFPSPIREKPLEKSTETMLLQDIFANMGWPTHAEHDLPGLAPSSRYLEAQTKAHQTEEWVRADLQHKDDVSSKRVDALSQES